MKQMIFRGNINWQEMEMYKVQHESLFFYYFSNFSSITACSIKWFLYLINVHQGLDKIVFYCIYSKYFLLWYLIFSKPDEILEKLINNFIHIFQNLTIFKVLIEEILLIYMICLLLSSLDEKIQVRFTNWKPKSKEG